MITVKNKSLVKNFLLLKKNKRFKQISIIYFLRYSNVGIVEETAVVVDIVTFEESVAELLVVLVRVER